MEVMRRFEGWINVFQEFYGRFVGRVLRDQFAVDS